MNYNSNEFEKRALLRRSLIPIENYTFENKYRFEFMKNHWYDCRKTPHIAISGQTGSGKSMLMIYIMLELVKRNSYIYVIDTKKSDLFSIGQKICERQFSDEYNAESSEEILKMFERLIYLMNMRQAAVNEKNKFGADFSILNIPPVFLFIDELNATVAILDKRQKEEFYRLLTQIILKGRSAGINVIVGSQQLNAQIWPSYLRDQMGFRIFLSKSDSAVNDTAKEMIFGKIESYPLKKEGFGGWYLLESEDGEVKTFESPILKNFDIEKNLMIWF